MKNIIADYLSRSSDDAQNGIENERLRIDRIFAGAESHEGSQLTVFRPDILSYKFSFKGVRSFFSSLNGTFIPI